MEVKDRINLRLKKLLEYVAFLKRYEHITVAEMTEDELKQGAIERKLQLAAEVVAGIANMINAEYRLPPGENAGENIRSLGKGPDFAN